METEPDEMGASLQQIDVEITTRCFAGCIVCPYEQTGRKNRDMSSDEILSVVQSAYEAGAREVHTCVFGEPTLHPQYVEIFSHLKAAHPDVVFAQYTNGCMLYRPEIRETMHRVFDRIVVSIDGATNETMKKTRPGLDPEKVRNGLKELFKSRKGTKPKIQVRATRMPENEKEIKQIRKIWKPYCDEVLIAYLQSFRGFKKMPSRIRGSEPCDRVFYHALVTVDQNVTLCADDYKAEFVLGNLKTESLSRIWHGPRMNEIRSLHLAGRSKEIPMCAKCTYLGTLKRSR